MFSISFFPVEAQDEPDTLWSESLFKGLEFRSIGPALMAGRIADMAIHPEDDNVWYVAVGSGGVWKTKNAGVTWDPIFDGQSSYSTGCVTIDPNNPNIVWIGTGENVGGRHVGYGDGIYVSHDGGETWKNKGLKESEHISKIIIHPENSDMIWVAVQGPLWSKGGERGLYITEDGGETWTKTLGDDEWVGVTDLVIDPRDPNRLYAATWQRHRTIAAYMGGGPGTGLHKSTDGGKTWTALTSGLPKSNMGKIGLAISPQNPDVLYAAIELDRRTGGVYKSNDRGANWTKQSDAVAGATGPHYYQELYASPHQFDKLYLVDVRMQVSEDGGRNFRRMREQHKHSDNHAIAFRMDDPDYLLVGTDGGLYESFDGEANWRFIDNMPITQFYKLAVDDAEPFYNVYGGTQDNSTQGGPSRTDNVQGIQNSDWKVVLNWDGHQPATEPGNPNIIYGQRQEGTLSRIDMKTGEVVDIQPQPGPNETYERFNWDAPILVSPHDPKTIFFASQYLYRSENRGDNWTRISDDLTRNQNRLELEIMGKKQSWDNAWDFLAMSNFNTITSIAESPIRKGLIYVGTDDGLIQVSDNMGDSWRTIEVGSLPGAPPTAYVNDIKADLFDTNTIYVALDNHKHGDLDPYFYKSTDRGYTWTTLHDDLPKRHIVWRVVQDHVDKDLLFLATEFGIFFTYNGGGEWIELKGGLPTISFRDITIQRRENDLVAASFGRSFYILDDYTALRGLTEEMMREQGLVFKPRKAWWYFPRPDLGFGSGPASQGASHFIAPNPPFGTEITYYIKEDDKTAKERRKAYEKKLEKEGKDIPFPGWDSLEYEALEDEAYALFLIRDANDNVVRKLTAPWTKGFHRINWNLRRPSPSSIALNASAINRDPGSGLMVGPGNYSVEMQKVKNANRETIGKQSFKVEPLREGSLEGAPTESVVDFWRRTESAISRVTASRISLNEIQTYHSAIEKGYKNSTWIDANTDKMLKELKSDLSKIRIKLNGSELRNQVGEKNEPTIGERLFAVQRTVSSSTYGPTATAKENMDIIEDEVGEVENGLIDVKNALDEIRISIENRGGPKIPVLTPGSRP